MSLTVNIKNLSVSLPGAAKPFPPILALALASALDDQAKKATAVDPTNRVAETAGVDITPSTERRYGVIQSHARLAADGSYIAADDTTTPHVAVVDNATGLMWSVESLGDPSDDDSGLTHAECEKRCAELRLLSFDDWRLPTRAELAGLIDDTRHEPAIDTALFPRVKPRWHWTSTPAAWSSASAWYVYFGLGGVSGGHRDYGGFALAVRRAGQ